MITKYATLSVSELRRELEFQIEQGMVDMELCKEIAARFK